MRSAPGTAAAAREEHRFAVSLQSALSLQEVESTYLRCVPGVVFARANGLYRLDPTTGSPVAVAADAEQDFLEEYEEFGRADDPVLVGAQETGRPIDNTRVGSRTAWEASGAYQCLDRAGYYSSMEAPVLVTGIHCATLNFARWKDDPPFRSADLDTAHRLSEHIGLAMERAIRYEETDRRATLLEDALDRLPQAVVVTDLEGNVVFSNRAASTGGNPSGVSSHVQAALDEAMTAFRRENKRVNIAVAESGEVAGEGPATRMIVKSVRLGERGQASVSLVYPCTGDRPARLPAWDLLSPREQEIAQLVSHGLTTKEIAARAFVTENTVKQHLKRIFAKTDVRNRAELVQRIWTARSGGE